MSDKTIEMLISIGEGLLILLAGLLIIKIVLVIVRKALNRSSVDEALYGFVLKCIKVIGLVVLIIVVLSYFKVPTAPIVTVLGAGGAAIALALKDSLGNIAGGMLILINKPFAKGDFIEVTTVTGYVEKIDLFNTTLKTIDNKVVTIPNGTVTNSVLINYSKEDSRRVDCTFGVGYDCDLEKAKSILLKVAGECPFATTDREPIIGVISQDSSAVMIDLKAWCHTEDYWLTKYYLEEKVKLAFDEAGIEIPFNQMDVHIKNDKEV